MNARAITTRREAIERSLARYFTGEPCHAGHYSERNRFHDCVECNRIKKKRSRGPGTTRERDYSRAYYLANKEVRLACAKKWRQENLARDKERRAQWWADRPALASLYARRRRALKAASIKSHTVDEIAEIAAAQKHRCAYCRIDLRKVAPQVDHIEPLSRGGSNDRRNLQLTCKSCNSSKRAKDPIEFARAIGRLI